MISNSEDIEDILSIYTDEEKDKNFLFESLAFIYVMRLKSPAELVSGR